MVHSESNGGFWAEPGDTGSQQCARDRLGQPVFGPLGGVTWPISDRLPRCRLDTRRMLDLYSPLTKLSVVLDRFCDIATPSS